MKKNFPTLLSGILILFLFTMFGPLTLQSQAAEVPDIIAEYTYNIGDGETPAGAEEKAVAQAKRIAVEEASTYVESDSEVAKNKLTKEEISAIAGGIIKTTVLEKRQTAADNGFFIYVKIKADVDPAKIADILSDRSMIEQTERLQAENARLLEDIKVLQKSLLAANDSRDKSAKETVKLAILANEKRFHSNQLLEQGHINFINVQYDAAIECYTQAIAADTKNADAYNSRGYVYNTKKLFDLAIADLGKAIASNPKNAFSFNNLGFSYAGKGLYNMAIANFDEALVLNSRYAAAYFNKAVSLQHVQRLNEAANNYKLCIQYLSTDDPLVNTAKERLRTLGQ